MILLLSKYFATNNPIKPVKNMENNISKLYEFYRGNALLITKIHRAEDLYRRQLHGSAGNLFTEVSKDLSAIEQFPEYLDKEAFQNSFIKIASALNSEDFVLLADSLDSFVYEVLLPIQQAVLADLSDYISDIYASLTKASNGIIDIEETALGYPTLLYHSGKSRYLCSTVDPMLEAYRMAKENFKPEADSYRIWGIGAGYHIYALYQLTHGSTDIYVYDTDSFLFDIAKSGKLGSWQEVFSDSRIHLIEDPDATKFSASLAEEGTKIILHMPSVHKLPEGPPRQAEKKSILKRLQLTINTFEEQKNNIYLNFYKNIKHVDGFAEELFPEYEGQNVVIVAAGPSLDKNIHILKNALDDGIPLKVLCVGTVLRKLVNYGIKSDAFFEMDANKITYAQISGLEDQDIPLILNSSTYFELARNYHGKKYLACQSGFEPAEKLGHRLFNTGSSVTTLALDFAIQAKAAKIILIGCDMAYTGDASHASGTVQVHNTSKENTITAKGYYGDTVSTTVQLSMFREWIERRLTSEDAKSIKLINATEGGAYIEGMNHMPLKKTLSNM